VFAALFIANPLDGYIAFRRAAADFKLGNFDAALAGYTKAIDLNPKSIAAYANRAEIYFNRGELRLATFDLGMAIALDPAGEDPFANRARALAWAVNDVDPGYAELSAIARGPLRLGQNLEDTRREVASNLRKGLQTARAVVDQAAAKLATGATAADVAGYLRQATIGAIAGQPQLVRKGLRERASELADSEATGPRGVALSHAMTEAFPDDHEGWTVRARAALFSRDWADAVQSATRAIEAGADNATTYGIRAMARVQRFDPEAALADLDRVSALTALGSTLERDVEAQRAAMQRAVAAIKIVRELRDKLDAGSVSPQDLVRRWAPFPLGVLDFREAAAGKRRLADELKWTPAVTLSIGALAEAYAIEGAPRLAKCVAEALALVDPTQEIFRQVAEAAGEQIARGEAPPKTPAAPTVRILFLGANPSDQTRLALTSEVERLGARLRATTHGRIYQIAQHWEVKASGLQRFILEYRPQIVHFSGHGTSVGELVFEGADGASAPMPIETIASVFGVLKRYVRCVVLAAC
jgi:tetratricopeptide (TPR) repeat protein